MRARSWAHVHPTAFGVGVAALYLAPHLVPGLDVVLGLLGLTPLGPVLSTLVRDALNAIAVLALGCGTVTVGSVRGHSWCAWAAAVCCGVVAAVVGGICGTAITLTLADAAFASYQGALASSPAWLTGLTTIAVAPVAEELVFRGSLYRGLRRRWPALASGLVSAAAFALAHGKERFHCKIRTLLDDSPNSIFVLRRLMHGKNLGIAGERTHRKVIPKIVSLCEFMQGVYISCR